MDISTHSLVPDFMSQGYRYLWDASVIWQDVISGGLRIFGVSLHEDCNAW
jgi:hypothetical protein